MEKLSANPSLRMAIEQYFAGERSEMFAILATCVALLLAAFILLRAGDLFSRGLAIPFLVIIAIFGGLAVSLLVRDAKHSADLISRVEQDPGSVLREESPRIEKVISLYPTYRYVYLASIVAALILFLFLRRPFWQGVAVGLLFLASIGYIIDHYSEQRATNYYSQLQSR